ncbi:hypothetical protein CPB86DRAFT_304753 [Serendipita vermifera]|nr:hypothetical protein CPB86DRAFT_304753 [Serendipita vermifera]
MREWIDQMVHRGGQDRGDPIGDIDIVHCASGNKGDGPVASEVQLVEMKTKLGLTGRPLARCVPDAHVSRHTPSHNTPAMSESATISPTAMHRIFTDRNVQMRHCCWRIAMIEE